MDKDTPPPPHGTPTRHEQHGQWPLAESVADFQRNLAAVRLRMAQACQRAGRPESSVRLLPVSKTVDEARIRLSYAAGCRDLGENKVQEAHRKCEAMADLADIRWSVIGHLQTNKAKDVAALADEFQALDSLRVAAALDRRLQTLGRGIDVLVQVNTSSEESKFGLHPDDLAGFLTELAPFSSLRVRGLMTLAALSADAERVRGCFALLRDLRDGGTLQIGIGSLGDAIAQAILVRERNNDSYYQMIQQISGGQPSPLTEYSKFEEGLYGASEMFVNGFMQLIDAGIIRREVFNDPTLQRLLNQKAITPDVTAGMLDKLLEAEAIESPLRKRDFNYLKRNGIFNEQVQWQDGELVVGDERSAASLQSPENRTFIHAKCLGKRLKGGIFMHGGFFLGPRDFYQKLRDMPPEKLAKIGMSRIGYINQLYGHEEIARLQRQHARFINTTMMTTLLGAAVSDSLDSGKLVSGVGGQYNFVAMGHALPDARSILMMRATRVSHGKVMSNVVWNYGHTTIPRHLRDIVITEYGIADLRGQSDAEVIKRLLAVADSRFQEELLHVAKENGKIDRGYEIPASQRNNLPDIVESRLKPWRDLGLLPDFPFGTDFTADELTIVRALQKLKHATEHPLEMVKMILSNIFSDKQVPEKYLERMHLEEAHGIKLKLARKLFVGNL